MKKGKLATSPCVSPCIPMSPHALAILPFSARKGINDRKKGKFQGFSADFWGFRRDIQGGMPFLFVGVKEKNGEKFHRISADFIGGEGVHEAAGAPGVQVRAGGRVPAVRACHRLQQLEAAGGGGAPAPVVDYDGGRRR